MVKKRYLLSAVAILTLAGCGGGGGSSTTAVEELNGKVIDGYIEGATVCLDLNNDGSCGEDEPKASTNKNGEFSLRYPLGSGENAPILAYGGKDVDTGENFEGVLKAPKSFSNITPSSTIVNEYMALGKSEEEATKKVAELLGVSVDDLKKDPVEELKSSGNDELLKANLKIEKSIEALADDRESIEMLIKEFAKSLDSASNFDDVIDTLAEEKKQKSLSALNSALDSIDVDSNNLDEFAKAIEKCKEDIKEGKDISEETLKSYMGLDELEKAKDKAEEEAKKAQDKADETKEEAKDKAKDEAQKVEDTLKDKAKESKETLDDEVQKGKDKADDAKESAKDDLDKLKDALTSKSEKEDSKEDKKEEEEEKNSIDESDDEKEKAQDNTIPYTPLSVPTSRGKVIDGYVVGATVCFDINSNNICDSGEPQSKTDSTGGYSLSKNASIGADVPVIAYGGVDTDTGKPFTGLLKAPQGFTNITPASTLISEYMKQNSATLESALDKVAKILDLDDKALLVKDPVEMLKSGDDRLTKANLKLQKVIDTLATSKDDVPNVLGKLAKESSNSESLKDLINATAGDKAESLKTLANSIENTDITPENIKTVALSADDLSDKIENGEDISEDDLQNAISVCEIDPDLDDSGFTDTPPNNGENIPYFTVGESVSDIEAAFNYARSFDSTVNGKKLELPSQSVWDSLSPEERGLYILNRERVDRGLKPFEGVEAMNKALTATTLSNPSSLADVAQAYTNLLYQSTSLSHTLDGDPTERINRVPGLKESREFIPYNESLYAEGNSFALSKAPIEKAIYNWIYADANVAEGEAWGHRAMCLMKVDSDDFGTKGAEGILAFGLKQGSNSAIYPNFQTSLVTLNAINPTASFSENYKKSTLCYGKNSEDDRFKRENGLIEDTKTTLVWQDIELTQADLAGAKDYCENLELAGFDDWRLPKASELSDFYKSALSAGVTPNLSQINITKMSADGGYVFTAEGAEKYSREVGEITNDFAETSIGDVRCVRGEAVASDDSTSSSGSITLDSAKEVAIDESQGLMFENNPSIAGRMNIEYGKIACNNLELGDFTDWRLATPTELSTFHKNVKDAGVSINYYSSYCTYETTDDGAGNSYKAVRVQSDSDDYKIGDIVTFGSSAGVRCVRANEEQDTTVDTTPPARVEISYVSDSGSSSTLELSDEDDPVQMITYIKVDYNCTEDDDGKISCEDFSIDFKGEPGAKLYSLNSDGSLPDQEIAILDDNGEARVDFPDSERSYTEGFNTKEGHFFDQVGDFVLVDEAGNISKINRIMMDFFKEEDSE